MSQTLVNLEFETRIPLVALERVRDPLLRHQLQAAEAESRYLTPADLQALLQGGMDPDRIFALHLLRDQATDLIQAARHTLLKRFPSITEPGGGLYPPERAKACWRDLWHFLRCVSYGIALGQTPYIDPDGLARLASLYRQLSVPLEAMVVALEALKDEALSRLPGQQAAQQVPYFNHLIEQMRSLSD